MLTPSFRFFLITLIILVLCGFAICHAYAEVVEYDEAKADLYVACVDQTKLKPYIKPCEALEKRMKAGYLVRDVDYNNWCGVAMQYVKEIKKYESAYKKETGKKINYKNCPPDSLTGL